MDGVWTTFPNTRTFLLSFVPDRSTHLNEKIETWKFKTRIKKISIGIIENSPQPNIVSLAKWDFPDSLDAETRLWDKSSIMSCHEYRFAGGKK
jgi:hypothetical protein